MLFCASVVGRGHSVLTCWPLCSSALHKSIRRRSYDCRRRRRWHPPSLLFSLSLSSLPPSSHPSCSHCLNVIWQTKRLFIQSRNKTQHPPFTLRLSNTPTNAATFSKTRLSRFFFFISRGRELLTPDQRGYHSKHGRDPDPDTHPVYVCVSVRECDPCMQAMKNPIVVMRVCLISVYTTMSVVLWSPLVRLFVGLYCETSGNAEENAEIYVRVCVRPVWVCYQRHTSAFLSVWLQSRLRLTRELSVSDASWFTASRPHGSRIGWCYYPVCQLGARGVEFNPVVYFMPFNNLKFTSLSTGPEPLFSFLSG